MFVSLSSCPVAAFLPVRRHALPGVALAACAALALLAAVATLPRDSAAVADSAPLTLRADDPVALRDNAEALRASLLRQPGTGAVTLTGLHQQRLAIEYTPRHLAMFGVSVADLAAELPIDAAGTHPGHLALRADAAFDSPQDLVNLPVHTGGKTFRLGDVALVSRAKLDPPVSTLTIDGKPAVRIIATQTR